MKTARLETARLEQIVAGFGTAKIAIVGDFFLDKYLDVDPAFEELSVETSLPAHQVARVRCAPGAAGTVARNLNSLGAGSLFAIGFTGDDGEGFDLRKQLKKIDCNLDQLLIDHDRATPTYLKPRNKNVVGLAGEHSRYDTKNRDTTPPQLQQQLVDSIRSYADRVDAFIVLDQVHEADCGVVTGTVRKAIAELASERPDKIIFADSRRLIADFRRVIIKPNQFEAAGVVCPQPGDEIDLEVLLQHGSQLRSLNQAPVMITRGEKGVLVSDPEWTLVPAVQVASAVDPTGAGDSTTAGTVLALCAGATIAEAATVGNLVASITIQQLATTGVATPEQVLDRLPAWQQALDEQRIHNE